MRALMLSASILTKSASHPTQQSARVKEYPQREGEG